MKTLTATTRNLATSLDGIRSEGFVPSVAYKNGMDNLNIQVPENLVRSVWKDIKEKQELTLDVEGTQYTAVLQDIQVHVVTGAILHMDFLVK